MPAHTAGPLPLAALDIDRLADTALERLARGATSVLLMSARGMSSVDRARWAQVVPDVPVADAVDVADVRAAIGECGRRGILVLAVPPPQDPARFAARALQGAADSAEAGVPGVAIHVVRDRTPAGPVGWLSQTGARSGYGVLFAMGYAQLHDLPVVLVEPAGGVSDPRTPDALDEALDLASRAGLEVTTVSDPSPLDRVLRDRFSLVVHPVLDVRGGWSLLHPDELPRAAVAEGNPAAWVRLLSESEADVVAVLDGVRLLGGESHALAAAAAIVLSAVALGGAGVALAPAASAAGNAGSTTISATAAQSSAPGVTVSAAGHNGNGQALVHVVNRLDHSVTIALEVTWVHSGNHPPQTVHGATVTVPAGSQADYPVARPTAIGHGGYHVGSTDLVVRGPGGPLLTVPTTPDGTVHGPISSPLVPVDQLSPQFQPPQVVVDPPEEGDLTEVTVPIVEQPRTPIVAAIPQPGMTSTVHGPVVTPPTVHPPLVQGGTQTPPVAQPPAHQVVTPPTHVPPVTVTPVPDPGVTTPGGGQGPVITPPTQVPVPTVTSVPDPGFTTPGGGQLPVVTPPQEPPITQTTPEVVVDPPETTDVTEVTLPDVGTHVPVATQQHAVHPGTTDLGIPDGGTGGGELAHTGAPVGILAGLAAALLAVGGGAMVASRRRTGDGDDDAPAQPSA